MTGTEIVGPVIAHITLEYLLAKKAFLKKQTEALARSTKAGKLSVLVIGSSGTGKSTLGKLFGAKPERGTRIKDPHASYNISNGLEQGRIEGYWFTNIKIFPGQSTIQENDSAFNDMLTALRDGKFDGIIHVVAGGLHAKYAGRAHLPYELRFAKSLDLNDPWLIGRREMELVVLERITEQIKACARSKAIWMITAINKQDIWYEHRTSVLDLYEKGPYKTLLESMRAKRGDRGFTHEFLELCLTIENYFNANGNVEYKTAAGYDTRMQIDSILRFMQGMCRFCEIDIDVKAV